MSPEPNKSIEELLQASAQARRAQFGGAGEMPNPMRAQLHEEISRATGVEETPVVRTSWLAAYWPRAVIGAAVAAVVVGFPLMWWRSGDGGDVASRYAINEPLAPAMDSAAAPAPPPARQAETALAGRLAETQEMESAKANEAQEAPEERARMTAAIQPAAPAAEPVTAPARPETTSEIAGAGVVAEAKPTAGEFVNVRQQFTQTPLGVASRANLRASKAAVEVLNTFQVEQEGNMIRLIDADGSTYTGTVQLVARSEAAPADASTTARREQSFTAQAPAAGRPRSAAVRRTSDDEAQSEFTFRATGYNASLKKEVVFEGSYIAPPGAPPAEPNQRGAARAKKEEDTAAARVIGTARIPGEAPVPVDATAAPARTER